MSNLNEIPCLSKAIDETSYFNFPASNSKRVLNDDETIYFQLPSPKKNVSNRSQIRSQNRSSIPRQFINNSVPYVSNNQKNFQDTIGSRINPKDLEDDAKNISSTSNISNISSEEDDSDSEIEEEKCTKDVRCPGADHLYDARITKTKSSGLRCPGTLNLLTRRMVPCNEAPTLREIALGRKIPRPYVRKIPIENGTSEMSKKKCSCHNCT